MSESNNTNESQERNYSLWEEIKDYAAGIGVIAIIAVIISIVGALFNLLSDGVGPLKHKIYSVEDWNALADYNLAGMTNTIELMNDLDFSDTEFKPLNMGTVSVFNGNNYSIKNIKINCIDEPIYLMTSESSNNIDVNDLKIDNITINSSIKDDNVSLFGNKRYNFTNVSINGKINAPFSYSIGGYSSGEDCRIDFVNCKSELTITGGKLVGGFIGQGTYSTLENCESNVIINSKGICGGFAGDLSNSKITSCTNLSDITTTDTAGGLVGVATNCTFTTCTNEGDISAAKHIGGIAGYQNNGKITQSINSGNITANVVIDIGTYFVGGIVGTHEKGEIMSCTNNGNVSNSHSMAGGIIGYCLSGVAGCENNGNIYAEVGAGGIVGFAGDNNGTIRISHCVNNGNVRANGSFAGGVIGIADLNSKDSTTYDIAKVVGMLVKLGANQANKVALIKIDSSAMGDFFFDFSNSVMNLFNKATKLELAYCESNGDISSDNYAAGLVGIMLSCAIEEDELNTNEISANISCSKNKADGFILADAADIYNLE